MFISVKGANFEVELYSIFSICQMRSPERTSNSSSLRQLAHLEHQISEMFAAKLHRFYQNHKKILSATIFFIDRREKNLYLNFLSEKRKTMKYFLFKASRNQILLHELLQNISKRCCILLWTLFPIQRQQKIKKINCFYVLMIILLIREKWIKFPASKSETTAIKSTATVSVSMCAILKYFQN